MESFQQKVSKLQLPLAIIADFLEDVDLKGAIVICRYGGIFRGLKVGQ